MQLVTAERHHLPELMGWFRDARSCLMWGGPGVRFPFEADRFEDDIRFAHMDAYAWVGSGGALAGFGQTYVKRKRCHLARLAIAPARRGQGLGRRFVALVAEAGCARYDADECSLYVLPDNRPALRCYRGLGFRPAPDPDPPKDLPECVFMVASRHGLRAPG